ncbi:unnamed protein product [Amoebophrya sp. A25]|nr:unnamed protein product [Amoebophrya sp. A25]|eukprot:GSA25T00020926001.1
MPGEKKRATQATKKGLYRTPSSSGGLSAQVDTTSPDVEDAIAMNGSPLLHQGLPQQTDVTGATTTSSQVDDGTTSAPSPSNQSSPSSTSRTRNKKNKESSSSTPSTSKEEQTSATWRRFTIMASA